MTNIYNYITTNWVAIGVIITAAVTLAGRIVELTPGTSDNAFLAKVIAALKVVGLKVGPQDPANPDAK